MLKRLCHFLRVLRALCILHDPLMRVKLGNFVSFEGLCLTNFDSHESIEALLGLACFIVVLF